MWNLQKHLTQPRWWLVIVVTVALAWWGWRATREAVAVQSALVTSGPLRVSISEAGVTRIRQHADVNAPVAGRWVPDALHNGDVVRVGRRLGLLYAAPLDATAQAQARARLGSAEAALREAESRIAAARSGAADAERALRRLERVAAAGGISPQDLERAQTQAEAQQAEFEAARLHVQMARFDADASRSVVALLSGQGRALVVSAPVDGQLLHLYEEHQRVVQPGTTLAEVGNLADLEVVVPLLTADAVRVEVGATVRMNAGSVADTQMGRVTRIEPSAFTKVSALGVDEQRVNVIVSVPSQMTRVGDRYRVETAVTLWESPRVLRVPTAALMRDADAWSVYVVQAGRAVRRTVRLGERSDDLAQVLAGVSEGERVVLYPSDQIAPGVRVRTP